MNKQVFQVFKRFIHDKKISDITINVLNSNNLIKKKNNKRKNKRKIKPKPMGIFNNLNEVVKARKNFMKVIR